MNILLDYQIFHLQRYGGISRYFSKLSEYLIKLNYNVKIHCPVHQNNYLGNEKIKQNVIGHKIKKFPIFTNRLFNYLNYRLTNRYLDKNDLDILHLTYFNKIYRLNKKVKKILTVYDLIHEKFNYLYDKSLIDYKKKSLQFADEIICISHNTKKDLLNFYDVDESKVTVIHLGVEPKEDIKKLNLDKKIILYVGDRRKYKNFDRFIKAYASSNKLIKNFEILCFGGGEFSSQEIEYIKNLNIPEGKVKQISGHDNILNDLYKSAEFLIVPSLYEGFGLPILEAMSFGCPVLCGNNSSILEVANNAALYFDADEVDSIKNKMEIFLDNFEIKSKLINDGLENIKQFSWENCANKTLDVYKKKI